MSGISVTQSRLDAIIWTLLIQTVLTGTQFSFQFLTKAEPIARDLHHYVFPGSR